MANTWNIGLIFCTFPILLSHLSPITLSLIFPTSFPNFCSFPSFFTVSHWETVNNDGFFALPPGNSWVSVLSRPPHPPKVETVKNHFPQARKEGRHSFSGRIYSW